MLTTAPVELAGSPFACMAKLAIVRGDAIVELMVIDLITRRFERLEKAHVLTNERLGRLEESLGRIVDVLEEHTRHFQGMQEALIGIPERLDRLTAAIARGRTQDLARFD